MPGHGLLWGRAANYNGGGVQKSDSDRTPRVEQACPREKGQKGQRWQQWAQPHSPSCGVWLAGRLETAGQVMCTAIQVGERL